MARMRTRHSTRCACESWLPIFTGRAACIFVFIFLLLKCLTVALACAPRSAALAVLGQTHLLRPCCGPAFRPTRLCGPAACPFHPPHALPRFVGCSSLILASRPLRRRRRCSSSTAPSLFAARRTRTTAQRRGSRVISRGRYPHALRGEHRSAAPASRIALEPWEGPRRLLALHLHLRCGILAVAATRQATRGWVQVVLVCEPDLHNNLMGALHPNGALYEGPVNVRQCTAQHEAFRKARRGAARGAGGRGAARGAARRLAPLHAASRRCVTTACAASLCATS